MHLPDKRLLVEGQSETVTGAAAGTAAADKGGSSKKKGFAWVREKAMRTGTVCTSSAACDRLRSCSRRMLACTLEVL